jgi:hypothetical protein
LLKAAALIAASAVAAAGCSSAPVPSHPGQHATTPAASRPPRHDPRKPGFTVIGSVPVTPNSSQDTHAQAGDAGCQRQRFQHAKSVGLTTAAGFSFTNKPVSGELLSHFLDGKGTAVRFGPRSAISRKARASGPFQALNRTVQAALLSQLRAGRSRVRLAGSALSLIRFDLTDSAQDLYFGFRGTQGLTVRGAGSKTGRRYTGRLTYVIRDSYGFPPQDQLLGVGTDMRYLQVNCGSPAIHGGARWFPDSITVRVPFRRRAG